MWCILGETEKLKKKAEIDLRMTQVPEILVVEETGCCSKDWKTYRILGHSPFNCRRLCQNWRRTRRSRFALFDKYLLTNTRRPINEHNYIGGADTYVCQIFSQIFEHNCTGGSDPDEGEGDLGDRCQDRGWTESGQQNAEAGYLVDDNDDGAYDNVLYNDDWWLNYDD